MKHSTYTASLRDAASIARLRSEPVTGSNTPDSDTPDSDRAPRFIVDICGTKRTQSAGIFENRELLNSIYQWSPRQLN